MKTTVDIPDDLYGQARKLAAIRGQQIATLITEALRKLVGAQLPRTQVKSAKNGKIHHVKLSPKAVRWLTEWRKLGQQNLAGAATTSSVAEILSAMRR